MDERYRTAFRDRFRSLFGTDFQTWFARLIAALDVPGGVQKVRVTSGDGGLDAWTIESRTVYQVFASAGGDERRDAKTASKIRHDFDVACATLGNNLKQWVFVHNHPAAALGKLSIQALSEIGGNDAGIAIRVLDIDSSWDEVSVLDEVTLAPLVGLRPHEELKQISRETALELRSVERTAGAVQEAWSALLDAFSLLELSAHEAIAHRQEAYESRRQGAEASLDGTRIAVQRVAFNQLAVELERVRDEYMSFHRSMLKFADIARHINQLETSRKHRRRPGRTENQIRADLRTQLGALSSAKSLFLEGIDRFLRFVERM